jgi:hypothetical protein
MAWKFKETRAGEDELGSSLGPLSERQEIRPQMGQSRQHSKLTHLGYVAAVTDARIEEWVILNSPSKPMTSRLDQLRIFIEG